MKENGLLPHLEVKYTQLEQLAEPDQGDKIVGYASLFGVPDQNGDVVAKGAFSKSLNAFSDLGRQVKMLWQHDPTQPIGVWDCIIEDEIGLKVQGRILTNLAKGAEAASLIQNRVIDGLSIGYQTKRSRKAPSGRELIELDLWEISLVTFPMLPEARVAPQEEVQLVSDLAAIIDAARVELQA